jgi:23S rRNA pseudouridine955/2504/2580 synthase/23S rRNA pseudouridine1911/1915/1917 synthase
LKDFSIIFENDDFIAVDKSSGFLSIPDRHNENQASLYTSLNKLYGKVFIVHRLDKDTSGLLVFAKNEETHRHLSQLFEKRNIEKYYLGIVKGAFQNPTGTINEPIAEHPYHKGQMIVSKKGKPSVTDYRVIEDYGIYSLVEFNIHSGRTHQIRVHAKFAGHPIIADSLYGDGNPVLLSSFKKKFKLSLKEEEERPLINRLGLHSYKLIFKDIQGQNHELEAPLPKDMRALLQQLKKNR